MRGGPERSECISEPERPMSLLSDRAILRHMELGNVVIEPFRKENLTPNAYDVTLGEWFYICQHPRILGVSLDEATSLGGRVGIEIKRFKKTLFPGSYSPLHKLHYEGAVFNPYDPEHVNFVWRGPHQARVAGEMEEKAGFRFENIHPEEKVILLPPLGFILAHTQEFIGGRNTVTTMMKARSSWGRNFVAVCDDAGWGDVGYINRWTMEIRNKQDFYVILVVGRRIAQIAFFEVEPPERSYGISKKYQQEEDIEKIKESWRPEMMLPRLWEDWEVKRSLDNS